VPIYALLPAEAPPAPMKRWLILLLVAATLAASPVLAAQGAPGAPAGRLTQEDADALLGEWVIEVRGRMCCCALGGGAARPAALGAGLVLDGAQHFAHPVAKAARPAPLTSTVARRRIP